MESMLKKQLKDIINKYKSDYEIQYDLMPFRVREILLVATVYDAYILEQEGKLSEQIFGEYFKLNLSTAPRITSVASGLDAIKKLKKHRYDMVIIMNRVGETSPYSLSKEIKQTHPNLPVLLLLNDNTDIIQLEKHKNELSDFDDYFVWNGDAQVFVAMIKYIEDRRNVKRDTKKGLVRVILLVEDSVRYYSRYLPTLYTEIIRQAQRLILEENLDEIKKLLRMRTRPKVLMAHNYNDAIDLIEEHKDYLLCVISDIKFPRNGKIDKSAGIELIKHVNETTKGVATLLQSSQWGYEEKARNLNSFFIHKDSENLSGEITEFIRKNLGFGDFVFRDPSGQEINRASTMEEFEKVIQVVPNDSLVYHAQKDHFSAWLMARGEIQVAKYVRPLKITDFDSVEAFRDFTGKLFKNIRYAKLRGKVINFDAAFLEEPSIILQIKKGSMGGKGRGIAFMNALLTNSDLNEKFTDINIQIPSTTIIGADEFDIFMKKNKLWDFVTNNSDFEQIKEKFLKSLLSAELENKLKILINIEKTPLAVRSSGLFEDSMTQHFSGIYDTFLIPNNHKKESHRLNHLKNAIKMIYASMFSPEARSYFSAIHYKVEEEKMSVIIQEVAGKKHGCCFYPHISGVAQSYNYYPVSYMKPEDGVVIMAVGLGTYVVGGENCFRFCPNYPKVEMLSHKELMSHTQKHLYAIDMKKEESDLTKGEWTTLTELEILQAEKDGSIDYSASVYDYENRRIKPGLTVAGPRLINFTHIIQYDYLPLAEVIGKILALGANAMGTPVEIEFAVSLNPGQNPKATFYLLQIKPMTTDPEQYTINIGEVNNNDLFLRSDLALGNGHIDDLENIIFIDPDKFNRSKTMEMSVELEQINKEFFKNNESYILIGPGRWGSSDKNLGIPVKWAQISNAKVIVEVGLEDFYFDPSLGSHFFHNVTSMHIGYLTIPYGTTESFIDWEWLKHKSIKRKGEYFCYVKLNKKTSVKMDGRKGVAIIYKT